MHGVKLVIMYNARNRKMGFGEVNNVLIQNKTHDPSWFEYQSHCLTAAVQPTQLCTGGCSISISDD